MAQLVVAAAGAAIGGSLITGTVLGMTGASIGWMAGSFIGGQLFGPKGQDVQGPRLGDLRVSGTEYGQTIPWVAGSPRIAGQIIWASNKRETATTQEAGKGGGGGSVTTYTYDVDLLILLTENETPGISRIWSNGELVYTGAAIKDGVWADVRVYNGAANQLPDPDYEAAVGLGNAPAHRGMTTVFIKGLQLGSSGQIPNLSFEIGIGGRIGWLSQASAISALGRVVAQIGGDAPFTSAGGGLDPAVLFLGLPTVTRTFTGPAEIGINSSVNSWQVETFIRPSGWVESNPGVRIYSNGFPQFRATIYQRMSTNTLTAFFETSSNWGAGGGIWRETSLAVADFPVDRFYHFALQYDAVAKRLSFFFDGRLVAQFQNSSVPVFPDNVIFGVEFAGGSNNFGWHNCGGLLLRPDLAPSELYQGTTFDVRSFTPPTSRLGSKGLRGWYDVPANPDALKDSIERQLVVAGLEPDEYALADLPEGASRPLRAVAISQLSSVRAVLEQMQAVWFFESSATDRINIRPRPTAPAASIAGADLAVSAQGQDDPIALTNANELEIPAQIALSYHNMAADYAVSTEQSDRLVSGQVSTAAIQVPLGMMPEEAKIVVEVMLSDRMAGMGTAAITVPLRYAAVEPGDIIDVTDPDAKTYRMRVVARRDLATSLSFDCVLDSVGSLESGALTDDGYINVIEPTRVAPSRFAAMDIPLLRDADDAPGYYAAVGADRAQPTDSWPGAVFVQAFTPEQFEAAFQSGNSALIGDCLTTLPAFGLGNVFDEASTVEVRVSGELASTTRDAMLDDLTLNAALIGSEIVRFRLATLLSTDGARRTYRLSGMLRGQRGTEWAIAGHTANERFVLLRASDLRRVESTLTQIGLARDVKGVTLNQLLSSVAAVSFTDSGESLRPFSPANPRVLTNGADMAVSWQRRTRRAVRYGGSVDQVVPLGEAAEQYRVRVIRAGTTLRTVTVTTPSWTYAAADITADGVTPGQSLTFEIRQLSAIVGEGRAASVIGVAP